MFVLLKNEANQWKIVTDVEKELPQASNTLDVLYALMEQLHHDPENFGIRMNYGNTQYLLVELLTPHESCPFRPGASYSHS